MVDGQGVPPVRELDELGAGQVLSVLLVWRVCVAGDLWSAVRQWGEGCDIAWQADETRVSVEVSRSPEARRTRL